MKREICDYLQDVIDAMNKGMEFVEDNEGQAYSWIFRSEQCTDMENCERRNSTTKTFI